MTKARTAKTMAPYKHAVHRGGRKSYASSGATLNADITATRALDLRIAGKSFKEIADELGLGYSSSAYEAVQRAFTIAVIVPNNQLREIEVQRLERLHAELWPLVIGDQAERNLELRLEVVDRLLKIAALRCRVAGLEQAPQTNGQDRANKLADMERAINAYIKMMIASGQSEPSREFAIRMLSEVNPQFAADVKLLPEWTSPNQ